MTQKLDLEIDTFLKKHFEKRRNCEFYQNILNGAE